MEDVPMEKQRSKDKRLSFISCLLLSVLFLTACTSTGAKTTPTVDATLTLTPSITIQDQSVAGGTVTVADVISVGPGWVAILTDDNGKPGEILGYTAVVDGDNQGIEVSIDPLKSTPVMYASLYSDLATAGTFEPENGDTLQTVGGQPIQPIFNVTAGLPSPTVTLTPGATPTSPAIVQVFQSAALGNYLISKTGITLYYWKRDGNGVSNCTGTCLDTWQPFLTNGQPLAGDPILMTGVLGIYTLPDGRQQVTYNDHPLYFYSGDINPGDTNGQGSGGLWFVFPAGGFPTATPTITNTPEVTSTPDTTTTPAS
jgi:predicted lipoprotein with Yx(FWY)xxD motif